MCVIKFILLTNIIYNLYIINVTALLTLISSTIKNYKHIVTLFCGFKLRSLATPLYINVDFWNSCKFQVIKFDPVCEQTEVSIAVERNLVACWSL